MKKWTYGHEEMDRMVELEDNIAVFEAMEKELSPAESESADTIQDLGDTEH